MAVKKTIDIDINTNAEQAAGEINDLNKSLKDSKKAYDQVLTSGDSYEKQLEDINKIVKTVPLNVRDMNKQIQAYQSIALSAGRETPIGQKALKQAADLKDKYIDIQNETKRLADDHKHLRGAMEVGTTVIAGYSAVQGAMALSGVESEALRETMVKLQGAQTLLAGVQQISVVLEKESAAMITLKAAKTKIATAATAAYATVTGTTTGALKLFKIALASTGIGLIVVGLGLLVANFDKVLGAMKPVIQAFKDFGDWIGLTNFAEEDAEAARKKRAEAQAKRADANAARLQKEIDNLKEIRDNIDKNTAAYQKQLNAEVAALKQSKEGLKNKQEIAAIDEQIRQKSIEGINKEYDAFKAAQQLKLEGYEKEINKNQERINAAKSRGSSAYKTEIFYVKKYTAEANNFTEYTEYQTKLNQVDIDTAKRIKEERKASNDRYKQHLSERLSIARKIQDLENSLLEDGIDKELEINRVNFERLKADAKGNAQEKIDLRALYQKQEEEAVQDIKYKYQKIADDKQKVIDDKEESEAIALSDKLAEIKEANAALFRTGQENELLEVANKYDVLEAMAQGNAEALEDINIARLNAENDINLQYANEAAANQKTLDDKTLAEKQELQALILQGAKDTFTTISNLAQLFAGESEESQRKAFKIQKAANIANATIDTYASAVAAFRSLSGVPIVGVPLGIAAAAAAVTAGMLNIKSIGQQEFGGSGGAEPDVPSFDAGAAQAPSFNVVGDSGINQLASLQQQPVQAFVVSGEVTTSQALDRNRVENATL